MKDQWPTLEATTEMTTNQMIFLKVLGGFLCFGLAAAAIVAWFPSFAERVSRNFFAWPTILMLVFLGVATWMFVPSAYWNYLIIPGLCLALLAIPITLGIFFFPAETRGGREVKPAPTPPRQLLLADRLRAPWSSSKEECPPAGIDMARFALLAYDTPGHWKKIVPTLGFKDHVPIDEGSAKAIVMLLGDQAVIAFQGTDDWGDWLTNLDKALAPPPADPIHRGFLKAYKSVAGQVFEALNDYGVRHVWITGHSLGGAMAVLCGVDLVRKNEVDVHGVITFGQPLFLVPAFAVQANQLLAGRHLRVIHEDDIVPRIAPGLRGGGSVLWFEDGKPVFYPPRMRAMANGGEAIEADVGIEVGPPPLTDEEYEAFKRQTRRQRSPPNEAKPGETVMAMGFPTADDHPMTLYLEATERHFGSSSASE